MDLRPGGGQQHPAPQEGYGMSEQNPETPAPEAPEAHEEQQQTQATTQQQADGAESQEDSGQEQAWDPERAMEKIRKVNSENRALRERAAAAERQAETVPELQTQNQTLGSENLRLKVGYELGLPLDLAVRLQGSTRDEMVADAEKLVTLIAPKPAPTSARPIEALRPGATPENAQTEDDVLYNSLFGG